MRILFIVLLACIKSVSHAQTGCDNAFFICSKNAIKVEKLNSSIASEIQERNQSCIPLKEEINGVWYKWIINNPGKLWFTITPLNPNSDIDFILYNSITPNCDSKEIIRCMAAGYDYSLTKSKNKKCMGPTGLSSNENDYYENQGCNGSQNNFLSPVDCKKGEIFFLFVQNITDNDGFHLKIEGDADFASNSNQLDETMHMSGYEINFEDNNECLFQLKKPKALITPQVIIRTYPNPTSDILRWDILSPNQQVLEITIKNITGSTIFQTKQIKNSINVHEYLSGAYTITFRFKDHIETKTWVKN